MSKKRLDADIKWLAGSWESLVSSGDYPTQTFIMKALSEIVTAYLRGQGVRIGNYAGLSRHEPLVATAMLSVVGLVIDEPVAYPGLHKVGLVSLESFKDLITRATKAVSGQR